jgi:hypothetical protein
VGWRGALLSDATSCRPPCIYVLCKEEQRRCDRTWEGFTWLALTAGEAMQLQLLSPLQHPLHGLQHSTPTFPSSDAVLSQALPCLTGLRWKLWCRHQILPGCLGEWDY